MLPALLTGDAEPFFPLDLQAVFSAGFVLALTRIAYPYVPSDASYIAKADEILGWMQMRGNVAAARRRSDLAELRVASEKVTAAASTSFGLATPVQDYDWPWETLTGDENGERQDMMSWQEMFANTGDAMQGQGWFWVE
jgi:hypothetical protein